MIFVWDLALVVAGAALSWTGGLADRLLATGAVLDNSDVMQFVNHDKYSSISQLIKAKSRDL